MNKKKIDVFDYASAIMEAMQKGVVVTAKADGQVNAMTTD